MSAVEPTRPPPLRAAAVAELSHAHAVVLRLRAAGATDGEIALVLGIEPEGVGPLHEVAEAKLRRLLGGSDARPTAYADDAGAAGPKVQ